MQCAAHNLRKWFLWGTQNFTVVPDAEAFLIRCKGWRIIEIKLSRPFHVIFIFRGPTSGPTKNFTAWLRCCHKAIPPIVFEILISICKLMWRIWGSSPEILLLIKILEADLSKFFYFGLVRIKNVEQFENKCLSATFLANQNRIKVFSLRVKHLLGSKSI